MDKTTPILYVKLVLNKQISTIHIIDRCESMSRLIKGESIKKSSRHKSFKANILVYTFSLMHLFILVHKWLRSLHLRRSPLRQIWGNLVVKLHLLSTSRRRKKTLMALSQNGNWLHTSGPSDSQVACRRLETMFGEMENSDYEIIQNVTDIFIWKTYWPKLIGQILNECIARGELSNDTNEVG